MKTCFSTLACPDFTWQEIYSMAKDFGFDGIEIRGLGQDIFSVKAAPFTDKELPKTIAKLKDLKLTIPCLSSGEPINNLETKDKAIAEIRAYCTKELDSLWDSVKRFENPHNYYVDLSPKLWKIKDDILRSYRRR